MPSPTVEPIDWGLVPASHLSFDQLLDIASVVRGCLARPDIAGAVVVQGTDVMEETAFAFDLLIDSPKPVVVVGAMRSAGDAGYEGPANLRDALLGAAAPALAGQGTVVIMGGAILAADDVVKTHTDAYDTFRALGVGPIGHVAPWAGERASNTPRSPGPATHPGRGSGAGAAHHGHGGHGRGPDPGRDLDGCPGPGHRRDRAAATPTRTCSRPRPEAMAAGMPVVLATRCVSGQVSGELRLPRWRRTLDRGRGHPGRLARRAPGTHPAGPGARRRPGRRRATAAVRGLMVTRAQSVARSDRHRPHRSPWRATRASPRSRRSPSTRGVVVAAGRRVDIEALAGPATERLAAATGHLRRARHHRCPPASGHGRAGRDGRPAWVACPIGAAVWAAIAERARGPRSRGATRTAGSWATAGHWTSWVSGPRPPTSTGWHPRGPSRSGVTTTTRAGRAPAALRASGHRPGSTGPGRRRGSVRRDASGAPDRGAPRGRRDAARSGHPGRDRGGPDGRAGALRRRPRAPGRDGRPRPR